MHARASIVLAVALLATCLGGVAGGSVSVSPRIGVSGVGPGTTITWTTGSARPGGLYVSRAGNPEQLVARGARGAVRARWVGPRVRYVFRLYSGLRKTRVLASRTIRQSTPRLAAMHSTAATMISWTTGSRRSGNVYVTAAARPERLFARGASGAVRVRWIVPGIRYVFRLYYNGSSRARPLTSLTVRRRG